MNLRYFLAGFLSALAIFIISFLGYRLGRDVTKLPGSSSVSIIPTITPETSLNVPQTINQIPTATLPPVPVSRENVAAAISSKNYVALESLLTDPVSVRMEATECCGFLSPSQALIHLEYLDYAQGTWDFSEDNEIVAGLEASYPEHYANAIIGVSTDNYIVAFQLDDNNKISKISMAKDYKILLP